MVVLLEGRQKKLLRDERQERADSSVTQVEASPHDDGEDDRNDERLIHSYVGRNGSAEIRGQEHRAEDRRATNHIEDGDDEQRDTERDERSRWISDLGRTL